MLRCAATSRRQGSLRLVSVKPDGSLVTDAATRTDDGAGRRSQFHRTAGLHRTYRRPDASTRPSMTWSGQSAPSCSSMRGCYRTLGGLDESYFLYSEETDFSLRAKGHGVGDRLHTRGRGNACRRWLRRERNHAHNEDPQPGPSLPPTPGTVLASIYFGLTVLTEVRRAVFGHGKSWPTLRALLRPSTRPPLLDASDSLLPR